MHGASWRGAARGLEHLAAEPGQNFSLMATGVLLVGVGGLCGPPSLGLF